MALERVPVPVLIQGGLAQDKEDVALGLGEGFVLVENLRYDRAGVLKKRGGYALMGSNDFRTGNALPIDEVRSLHSTRGALVALMQTGIQGVFGGDLPLAASYTDSGWSQHGAPAAATMRRVPAVRVPEGGTANAQSVRVGVWDVVTYLVDEHLFYKQFDAATGVVVQDERLLLDNVTCHRTVELNGNAVVVYKQAGRAGGELRAFRLVPDGATLIVAGPDLTIATTGVVVPFDAAVDEVTAVDLWVSWVESTVGVRIAQVAEGAGLTLTLGTTLLHAAPAATACSLEQNGNGQAWVAFHEGGAGNVKLLRYARAPFALAAPVATIASGYTQLRRTAVSKGGWVFWEGSNAGAGGGQGVFFQAFDGSGAAAFAVTGTCFWTHLASRPFTRRGADYLWLRDTRTRGYGLFFPDQVAAAPLVGSFHGAICLDSCIDADPTWTYPLADVSQTDSLDQFRWGAPVQTGIVNAASVSTRGRPGVDFVDIDFRQAQEVLPQSCEAANLLVTAGGGSMAFDGQQFCELGFLRPPFVISSGIRPGDGGIEGADISPGVHNTYLYRLTYEWQDERGNWHVSEPSEPLSIVVSLADTLAAVDLTISTLALTRKGDTLWSGGRAARIGVYRTLKNSSERYYRINDPNLQTLSNDRSQAFVQFADNYADATVLLLGFGTLYTEGGALEHLPAPSSLACATWGNRLWLVSAEDPRFVVYSKELIPTEGPTFNLILLSHRFDEEIVAIAPQGASLIAWSRDRTYALSGEGPSDAGALANWRGPFIVSEAVGCSDARSVVDFPGGVVWLAEQGFHVLAGPGATPQLIGSPVLAVTRSYPICRGAAHLPADGQLLWTLQATNSASICVVYDYLRSVWYVWTTPDGWGPSAAHSGAHHYATSAGLLRQFPGVRTDAGEYFAWRLVLPWARLAGVLGYQRCWRVLLALKVALGVAVVMRLRHDEEVDVEQEHSWTLADVTSPGGGRTTLDLHVRRQKSRSLQVELQEELVAEAETGAVEIYGLQIDLGLKKGRPKAPATNRS